MKTFLVTLISHIPGLRFLVARWIFYRPNHNTHRFLGVFPTYAAAAVHVPPARDKGFDGLEGMTEEIPVRDAEIVRILAEIIPASKSLFDLGGNAGLSFYQYRTRIAYPADFRWTICDVPYVVTEGRKIAAARGETQLFFTDEPAEAEGTEIYLTNGALQYFEMTFADMLAPLKNKPRHLLMNRVPLTELRPFFTLQNMGYSVVPYHINNLEDTLSSIKALGYRMVEHWKNDRFCDIILRPKHYVKNYHGFHFIRADLA